MCYKIEIFENKFFFRKGKKVNEILKKDIKIVRIKYRDNYKAKLLLLVSIICVFAAVFFEFRISIYVVFLILSFMSYILFFVFDKCGASLTIVTNKEKVTFKVDEKNIELAFQMIEMLHLKDYKTNTKKSYIFRIGA